MELFKQPVSATRVLAVGDSVVVELDADIPIGANVDLKYKGATYQCTVVSRDGDDATLKVDSVHAEDK
jgi:hypothetical protein